MDTWFIGFSPDLAVGVFAAFDQPRPLGRRETGSSVSAPIFKEFMTRALEGKPAIPFRVPPGVRLVRINANTSRPAAPGDKKVILEAFRPGSEPGGDGTIIDGSDGYSVTGASGVRGKY
jgi:penicillin-binding protein 1A